MPLLLINLMLVALPKQTRPERVGIHVMEIIIVLMIDKNQYHHDRENNKN